MDFLEFGMKNEHSSSCIRRIVAKAVLSSEKRRADKYEKALDKKNIPLPDDMDDAALLAEIWDKISGQGKE